MSIPRPLDVAALGLSAAVDVAAWSLLLVADAAAWLSEASGELAESARWYARASRLVP